MVIVQLTIVMARYIYGIGFLKLQELLIYLHGSLFTLAAGYTLLNDEHVRVDLIYREAPKRGFNTNFEGKDLYYWSNLIFNIAKKGLDKRNILNKNNLSESKFLSHLEEIIKSKNTNAENILKKKKKKKDLINFDEK